MRDPEDERVPTFHNCKVPLGRVQDAGLGPIDLGRNPDFDTHARAVGP